MHDRKLVSSSFNGDELGLEVRRGWGGTRGLCKTPIFLWLSQSSLTKADLEPWPSPMLKTPMFP